MNSSIKMGRIRAMIASIGFVLVVIISGLCGLTVIKKKEKTEILASMQTVMDTTVESLTIWIENNLTQLEVTASDPVLVELTSRQIEILQKGESLNGEVMQEFWAFFENRIDRMGNVGFCIISPNRKNIASMRDGILGEINLIHLLRPELLDKAFSGISAFIPPILSDVPIEGQKKVSGQNTPPSLFFATPIRDANNKVIAVLTKRLNPSSDFCRIPRLAGIAESGETYCIDGSGKMLTESRFTDQLVKQGLLEADATSVLSIDMRVPKTIQSQNDADKDVNSRFPLTLMAKSVLAGEDGSDMEGYLGYRGIRVVGIWRWLDQYAIGIATERELDEALTFFNVTRGVLTSVLSLLAAMMIVATVLILIASERVKKALLLSNEKLEEVVETRNMELFREKQRLEDEQTRSELLFQYSNDAIFVHGVSESGFGSITQANDVACNYLGYTRNELLNLNITAIDGGGWEREREIALRQLAETGQAIFKMNFLSKSGRAFPVEISSRVYEKDGEKFIVSLARDITELEKVHQELEQGRVDFLLAVKAAKAGTVVFDCIADDLKWDARSLAIFGIEEDGQKHNFEDWAKCLHPADAGRVLSETERQLGEAKELDLRYRVVHSNGDIKHVWAIANIQRDSTGKPLRVSGLHLGAILSGGS